jgi:type I restriction enzyme, S subunit
MSDTKWIYIDASEFCTRITDGTHDSPKSVLIGKPLITSKHIKGRNIDFESAYFISQEDYEKVNIRSKVNQWDVIISMIGEYCGYCYVERNEDINYAVKNVGIFKTGSKFKAEWLYYYLNSNIGKSKILKLKSGSSQPYLTLGSLRALPILFSNDEKTLEKIVNILSSLDAKIELNNRINTELEAMAKTLYDYWFVQFDFPNAEGKPYKSSGGAMVWSEALKREIPAGWGVKELSNVIEIKYGKDHKKLNLGVIPVYGSGGIMRYADKAIYDDESILIPRKGTLSNLFYLNKPFWSVDTMFFSKMKIVHIGKYLFYYLHSLNLASLNAGTAVPSLTTEILNRLMITVPSSNILKEFNDILTPAFEMKEQNIKENQQLSTLRDWLLPMLMNGQVVVA